MKMFSVVVAANILISASSLFAEEKLILPGDPPRPQPRFSVAPDGSRLYFAERKYLVYDAAGALVDQLGVPQGSSPADLLPLPDGKFIACDSYAGGHLALVRPDGTEERTLVVKGTKEEQLRSDMTGWTSPRGAAVDPDAKLIFALDTTQAPFKDPSPDWSRIAVYDFDGKFIRSINKWDNKLGEPDDLNRRVWYSDIAVDTKRRRIYVTGEQREVVQVFDYEGKKTGEFPGSRGLAVFADGRIAVGEAKGAGIVILDPDYKVIQQIAIDALVPTKTIADLETDAAGRLYASVEEASTRFIRWTPELDKPEVVGPAFNRIDVAFPDGPLTAPGKLVIKATATGRPAVTDFSVWQVLARPADGSNITWQKLDASYDTARTELVAEVPDTLRGAYEISVRFGSGPVAIADERNDLIVSKPLVFARAGTDRSVSVLSANGRRAFLVGEPIDLRIVVRDPVIPATVPASQPAQTITVNLLDGDRVISSSTVTAAADATFQIPSSLTMSLAPGRYVLQPNLAGYEAYTSDIILAAAPLSHEMQRILYHEFGEPFISRRGPSASTRMENLDARTRWLQRTGFTRETDRFGQSIKPDDKPIVWNRASVPFATVDPALAPAEWYNVGTWSQPYDIETYLDLAVARGIVYDTIMIGHCGGAPVSEQRLGDLEKSITVIASSFKKFPSFYGFNFNDEMFWGPQGFANGWTPEDTEAWKKTIDGEFKGDTVAANLHLLGQLYTRTNAAARAVDPGIRLTTSPMWQYPAVDGSYAPIIYKGMTESFTHFLGEGYSAPFLPVHNVEFLRRPGLPLMGVFDNGYDATASSEKYMKNAMLVLSRGVQGIGVSHTNPFEDVRGSDAYRITNDLARTYAPIFAECPPLNEGTILYSKAQDLTEARNNFGTPHWERVYTLLSAGMMAGLPMDIAYEEDVSAGRLLDNGKPRTPMLFLVGQVVALPADVLNAIAAYQSAGGEVYVDADSKLISGSIQLPLETDGMQKLLNEGYAADSLHPLVQPVLEKLALDLKDQVGEKRRFPVDSDDPWVVSGRFDGGDAKYVLVATETSPYPFDAGTVWSLGAFYQKATHSWLPKMPTISIPRPNGDAVLYDVWDRQPAGWQTDGTVVADLRVFPGRLYAVLSRPIGTPEVTASIETGNALSQLKWDYQLRDDANTSLHARVPLRVRLLSGTTVLQERIVSTQMEGSLHMTWTIPFGKSDLTMSIVDMISARETVLKLPDAPALPDLLQPTDKLVVPVTTAVTAQQQNADLEQEALSHKVGLRLSGIKVTGDGRHLLVSGDGYQKNLAVVEDTGEAVKVVRTKRVGEGPSLGTTFLSSDGSIIGAAARVVNRAGETLQLFNAADERETFAVFGDQPRLLANFGVSDDGSIVIAPGAYGVVAWKKDGTTWKEIWSIDYWKQFNQLDWPVSAEAERNPQFHAYIPPGADYALITFAERTQNGWITPAENASINTLACVNLSDGKERWKFESPVVKTLIFPTLYTSPNGQHTVLQSHAIGWGQPAKWYFNTVSSSGKSAGAWSSLAEPQTVILADATGQIAMAFTERLIEMRKSDGTLLWNVRWADQPVGLAFTADGTGLFVADDAGKLSRLDAAGNIVWQSNIGSTAHLASHGDTVFTAGWDGRIKSFAADGTLRWQLNLTPAMSVPQPMKALDTRNAATEHDIRAASRASTASPNIPDGANLLKSGGATLTLAGTGGWMSNGALQVSADLMTNGKTDDVTTPWLHIDEVFWDATAGRQVFAEITFPKPTDVKTLTAYENPQHPESFPTDTVIQSWDEASKTWKTLTRGTFLNGAVNTYQLDARNVSKLRYVPLGNYFRNFYTCEIEVR